MLFAPIGPARIRHARAALIWLRVLSSLAWIDSAFIGKDAKVAPAFFSGRALGARIHDTFVHTALDSRIAHVLTAIVLPHVADFAVLIAVADAAAGISLLLGFATRLGGAIAIARALTNIAVAGGLGPDTIGYNGMLAVAGALCMWTAAGREFGIDGKLIDRFPMSGALRLIA
jgi:hypothetical protein